MNKEQEKEMKHLVVWFSFDRRAYICIDANIPSDEIGNELYRVFGTGIYNEIHWFRTRKEALVDAGAVGWRKMQAREKFENMIRRIKFEGDNSDLLRINKLK